MTPNDRPCVGLILAGGNSRRMGQDKKSLTFDGSSWLNILQKKMQQVCEKVFVSVEHDSNLVGQEYLQDANPQAGPFGAWLTFSRHFPESNLLSVPVDMPLVLVEDLVLLSKLGSSGYLTCGNQHHYLLARVQSSDFNQLELVFDKKIRSARKFWSMIPHQTLQLPANPRFTNFNNPQDLAFDTSKSS